MGDLAHRGVAIAGRAGVLVSGGNRPSRHRERSRVRGGGVVQLLELGRPAGEAELGGDPGRVTAQRGDPDGQVGSGRLAQARRARGRGLAELGGLPGQQRATVLLVETTATGWPPAAIPHVSDRFYKADTARARSEGSGLGLAIAWENAYLHGGHIHPGNHPGGAVFTVSLPLNAPGSL
jgi:Histidine kinase-, DNA gyrase B-, and HSP90-like ATPase